MLFRSNIRYRGEKGYFISGKLAGGGTETTGANNSISVTLLNYPSHSALMNDSVMLMNPSRLFAFYGVADGEYEVVANTNSFGAEPDQAQFFAPPRRVSVKGGNVENVTLQMQMLASVAGKVMVESVVEKTEKLTCKSDRQALPDETVVKIVRDTGGKEEPYDPWSYEHTTAPNDKGVIKFRNLFAGHYYLATQLPDENWYVKAITLSGQNSAVAPPVKTNTVVTKSLPETDVGKQGLSLSAGEKKQELLLTIASGAASLSGKITAPQNTLLARMRVHLLPAEKEAADDLLRYSEVKTKADGAFVFANLAPGKYWLLLRNVDESEAEEKPAPPAAWDAKLRQQLRREAEAANNLVELKACQRVNDYVVIAEARTQ